jgi:hypothetical protein
LFIFDKFLSLKFAKLGFISAAQFRAPFPAIVAFSTVLHGQPIQPVPI